MTPAIRQEGAGPRTTRKMRARFGRTNASRTLTRFAVLCVLASNARVRDAERGLSVPVDALEVRPADEPELPYPLDGGVAVPPAGAGEPSVGVLVVVGWGSRGAGAGRIGGSDVVTGASTGGGAGTGAVVVVGGGGRVGTDTVGAGSEGTGRVGVVAVGTGSVGTVAVVIGSVTVCAGASIALPACTKRCAAANPAAATTANASLPNRVKAADLRSTVCCYNGGRSIRGSAFR
jgi:hypothetical protein